MKNFTMTAVKRLTRAMQTAPASLDPRLPPELERVILEIAAHSDRASIPKLVRVAWRVKEWIEPLLYEIIGIQFRKNFGGLPPRSPRNLAAKDPVFLHNSVRHLFFDHLAYPAPDLDWVLTNCDGITNILTKADLGEQYTCPLRAQLSMRHSLDTVLPLFRNVTHLECLETIGDATDAVVVHLPLMPALTHVAFNGSPTPALAAALLPNAGLQCIVFICTSANLQNWSVIAQDPRFVTMRKNEDYRLNWVRGAQTGRDYWMVVEAFIDARRTGKIGSRGFEISYCRYGQVVAMTGGLAARPENSIQQRLYEHGLQPRR
ncbi:hypothetical protein C8R46DRAFT_1234456 [Mycena filopes]|nr:hypothetical protein C8R46DRAFT_1234456 [Mycena filopes]